jgi:hypothetical protein
MEAACGHFADILRDLLAIGLTVGDCTGISLQRTIYLQDADITITLAARPLSAMEWSARQASPEFHCAAATDATRNAAQEKRPTR